MSATEIVLAVVIVGVDAVAVWLIRATLMLAVVVIVGALAVAVWLIRPNETLTTPVVMVGANGVAV